MGRKSNYSDTTALVTATNSIIDTPVPCGNPCPQDPRYVNVELVVMGNVYRETTGTYWTRGDSGWGSAVPISVNQLTDFQQHYLPRPPYGSLLFEAQMETAADMFLNWVYRVIDPNHTLNPPAYPGDWLGFLNVTWRQNDVRWGLCSTGCDDPSYPGDARFEWMNEQIDSFSDDKGC